MYRIAATGLVLAAIVVATPMGLGHSDPAPTPAPLPTAKPLRLPSGAPVRQQQPIPKPYIEESARARADAQMASSSVLKKFLSGISYKIKNEGYWTREGSATPIGLVREITLSRPLDTQMTEWPVIVWISDKNSYDQHSFNAQYKT
jgi:hypothetical protein